MAALPAIPRPRRWRRRSIRTSLMNSRAPTKPRRCSIWRSPASATAASPTRPPTFWRKGSRNSRAASAALALASGQAALAYAFLTLADRGGSIVAPPQLYRHHPYAARPHAEAVNGVEARFRQKRPRPPTSRALIDETTRAVFCESRSAIPRATSATSKRYAARSRMRQGVPLIVDNTVATPIAAAPDPPFGADIVVHSLTKFMGGHGVAMGGAIVDSGRFDWKANARRDSPMLLRARRVLSRPRLRRPLWARRLSSPAPVRSINAPPARCWRR